MKHLHSERYIRDENGRIMIGRPAGSVTVACKKSGAYVFLGVNSQGQPVAKAYTKRAIKPAFFYRYRNENERQKSVADWLASQARRIDEKVDRRKKENQPHNIPVGTIFYNSWGYEQTNIDFYEVVEVLPKSVKVRPIAAEQVESTGWLQGQVMPCPGKYTGEAVLKRVKTYDGKEYHLPMEHGYCGKWDGRPKHYTAYH